MSAEAVTRGLYLSDKLTHNSLWVPLLAHIVIEIGKASLLPYKIYSVINKEIM